MASEGGLGAGSPYRHKMELEATAGGRVGAFLATMEAAYWTYRAYLEGE
jgi:hypothetical protein